MTQKQALMLALVYAQTSFGKDVEKKKAARAICIMSWLNYTFWEADMSALLDRINQTEPLKTAFESLEKDPQTTSRLNHIALTLRFIFGEGLNTSEWRPTCGAPFVDELWTIINSIE